MSKLLTLWFAAGGGAMLGATAMWIASRPPLRPVTAPVRSAAGSVSNMLSGWRRDRTTPAASRPGNAAEDKAPGSIAFATYRTDTLRQLDAEERGFADFLTTLRQARDRQEFDAFLAARREPAAM